LFWGNFIYNRQIWSLDHTFDTILGYLKSKKGQTDAFNLNLPVLALGRIIFINNWYLLQFLDICGLVKQRILALEVSPIKRLRKYITSSF
jgi:hypothetical protein